MKEQPRVLIIEDDDALRAMLFTIVRHQPVAVDTAATAADALQKVLSCDYALILIDMNLPNGEAESFLRDFKRERPEATSFVIAVRDPKRDALIDSDVVVAVLDRPLELDMLAEVVRECAFLIPPPEEPLQCPPAESDIRTRLDRGTYEYPN